jgi:pimeloyl-ACP methyl ester carboxylesterase
MAFGETGRRKQERREMNHLGSRRFQAAYRVYASIALAFLLPIWSGCGGDDGNDTGPGGSKLIVEPNRMLSSAPHRFDIYRAEGAEKAIVFLHGGGGSKEQMAYNLGIKSNAGTFNYQVANGQILLDNKAMAVFPQGQALATAPTVTTWGNYATVSGQDDVQFIRDLVGYIASEYNISKMYIVGHSMGGVMVSRIWCEAPELFDAFISVAGPPSEHFLDGGTPCSPGVAKPFLSIVGSQDGVLQNSDWEAQTWTIDPLLTQNTAFVDPVLIGERFFLPTRVTLRCGGTVNAGDADAVKNGALTTWSYCGTSIRLIRIESAGHSMESMEGVSGLNMLELFFDFINEPW